MPTKVTIGYADGTPLEEAARVCLILGGDVVETVSPDQNGVLSFTTSLPEGATAALQLSSATAGEQPS